MYHKRIGSCVYKHSPFILTAFAFVDPASFSTLEWATCCFWEPASIFHSLSELVPWSWKGSQRTTRPAPSSQGWKYEMEAEWEACLGFLTPLVVQPELGLRSSNFVVQWAFHCARSSPWAWQCGHCHEAHVSVSQMVVVLSGGQSWPLGRWGTNGPWFSYSVCSKPFPCLPLSLPD